MASNASQDERVVEMREAVCEAQFNKRIGEKESTVLNDLQYLQGLRDMAVLSEPDYGGSSFYDHWVTILLSHYTDILNKVSNNG